MTEYKRRQLACRLDMTEDQVKVWFQNNRAKQKKTKLRAGSTCKRPEQSVNNKTPIQHHIHKQTTEQSNDVNRVVIDLQKKSQDDIAKIN